MAKVHSTARTHQSARALVDLPDTLTAHPITWIDPREIVNPPSSRRYPAGGPAYIAALVDAYQCAERGEGDWPPPIPCYLDGDQIRRCDGTHRTWASLTSGVRKVPILLFASHDAVMRASQRGRMNERERQLADERLAAARRWLAEDAAGTARLSGTDRASYQATVDRADADLAHLEWLRGEH